MPSTMKLYIKRWCPWCIRAREYLDAAGYQYDVLDVLEDPAAYAEMIRISNQHYTPTLSMNGKVLADFGVEDLDSFLKQNST